MAINDAHNFEDMNRCPKCGITLEEYENRGKPRCVGAFSKSGKSLKFGTGKKAGLSESAQKQASANTKNKDRRYI